MTDLERAERRVTDELYAAWYPVREGPPAPVRRTPWRQRLALRSLRAREWVASRLLRVVVRPYDEDNLI